MDLWDRAHEYNLTTINDELSGRNYAWLDGYAAAVADAAAVARDWEPRELPHPSCVIAKDDIAAAIESLVKPAIAPPP